MSDVRIPVALPSGVVEVAAAWEQPAGSSRGVVVIAHGAGAGHGHPFLVGFAAGMREHGYATLRFDFPYVTAGRRMPGPVAHAIATWAAAADWVAAEAPGAELWAVGKSYGGRMASMAAAERAIEPVGLVYLGYPLHPPGEPGKVRAAHLPDVAPPQLFVEGTGDPFVQPVDQFEQAVATCRDATVRWIDGGGHSFEVKGRKRAADAIGADLAPTVAAWTAARTPP